MVIWQGLGILVVVIAGVFVFALVHLAQVSRDATLTVRVLDTNGRPTPVRVRLENSAGVRPRDRTTSPAARKTSRGLRSR